MEHTKGAELVTAIFMYATRCAAEGDQNALRELNFGTREVEALRGLEIADLQRLTKIHGHCLDVELNRESFWLIVQHIQQERSNETIQHTLLCADAPYEMMRALFGLDTRTYTTQRNLAGVQPTAGRPVAPGEEESLSLWEAFIAINKDAEINSLTPADYLALYQDSNISLRTMWQLFQRWSEEAEPAVNQMAAK